MDKEEVVKELKRALRLTWDEKEQHSNIMDSDDALDVRHAIVDALELLKATSTCDECSFNRMEAADDHE